MTPGSSSDASHAAIRPINGQLRTAEYSASTCDSVTITKVVEAKIWGGVTEEESFVIVTHHLPAKDTVDAMAAFVRSSNVMRHHFNSNYL